jgi:sterol desaturase/sphingolipid hydroxylase (fatty acid hydroxylase superfamily)
MAIFTNFVLEYETQIRLTMFFGVLAVMAIWEWRVPRLAQVLPRRLRWPSNLGIVVLNTVLVRALFPVFPVGVAAIAEARGWGLFTYLDAPGWLAFAGSVVILDLAIYGQHVMFHKVPILWRLHRMHHADTAIDVTTGARFHPVEIALSLVIKMAVVAAIGAPPAAVVVFEVVLNATAMFNHANLRLPAGVDWVLRLAIVTPDMHRVHHSTVRQETDSNYGFNVPWWDRLFGTYIAQPAAGHDGMTIGLEIFRTSLDQRLDKMLLQPLR